jgi:hypothetical protein
MEQRKALALIARVAQRCFQNGDLEAMEIMFQCAERAVKEFDGGAEVRVL